MALIILLSLNSCYGEGYEAGKKRGIRNAESYARGKYGPDISVMKKELQQITTNFEKIITTMNENHADKIKKMNSDHTSKINVIESEHAAKINNMEYLHNVAVEDIKKSSYSSGQTNMEKRIGEMIDLDVDNKRLGTGWNDTVHSVSEN
jgi:5'-3' exonuclease